jgi:hypothetical protein
MATLMAASSQWASRPSDERFLSLPEMATHFQRVRENSRNVVVSSRHIMAQPASDDERGGIEIIGPNGHAYNPTHWAFGQLSQLAGAPAKYLRKLPAPLAADCVNYGLKFERDIEDVGCLLYREKAEMIQEPGIGTIDKPETYMLRAATGPAYGRIWNQEIITSLMRTVGDGRTGDFRVPGEFGKAVEITKANTTLYAGDRDLFVFLADEQHRIEIPNRRNGEPGSLARGFFIWNSEVGSTSFGIGTFLFDYVCCNRIVWGAQEYAEIRIRHSAGAPDRFLEQAGPALERYANASAANVVKAVEDARNARIETDVSEWLTKRFNKSMAKDMQEAHMAEEGRPIETLWDVTTAATAVARSIPWQNERVVLERQAGDIMAMAA